MALKMQINTGFVTNSSSTIFFYDKKEIMENPGAMAYIRMLGLDKTEYIGNPGIDRGKGDITMFDCEGIEAYLTYDDIDTILQMIGDGRTLSDVCMSYRSDEVGDTISYKFTSAMSRCGIHPFTSDEMH